MRNFSWQRALTALSLGCVLATASCQPETAALREDLEYLVHYAVNRERKKVGIPPLTMRDDLRRVARFHNLQMIGREHRGDPNAFDHRDAKGRMIEDRLDLFDIDWAHAGENLARNRNFDDPVQEAIRGWLQSPEHRKNMLSPRFRETGIAVHQSQESGITYFTQVMILRMPD